MPNDNPNEYPKKERYYDPPTTSPNLDDPAPSMPTGLTSPPPPPGALYPTPSSTLYPTPTGTGQNLAPGQYGNVPPGRPSDPPKKGNFWRTATLVMTVLAVILGAFGYLAYEHIINPPASAVASAPTTIATQTSHQTPTTVATVPSTPTGSTSTPSSTTPSAQVVPGNYSALQPGPGCDKNGGTWTPQGLNNITCGTQISDSTANTGYLFLQLPNNETFSANNKIGVIGNPNGSQCVGLDEQDANTGFLAQYCGDGNWAIYTISATDGSIVQTLDKNITSTRSSVDISLTFKGTTLSFSIDNEVHSENNITPIQPTKVAITDYIPCSNCANYLTVNNFSYTVLSS